MSTPSASIPVRRVEVKNAHDMPSRYSETPGGTIFSTTPGGTRIIYERKYLLNLKGSPLSKTPTKQLPVIPGVTLDDNGKLIEEDEETLTTVQEETAQADNKKSGGDQDGMQFDMDL